MNDQWVSFAAIAWDELADLAKKDSATTTYVEIEVTVGYREPRPYKPFDGIHATNFLTPIAEYCNHNRLPLLTLMATKEAGNYGDGINAFLLTNLADEIAAVRSFDWSTVNNPFTSEEEQQTVEALLSNGKEGIKKLLESHPQRGYQQRVFRKALLKAYGRCAVCSISHPSLLEAAHLKPWRISTEEERVDVKNGLLLCRNHHVAFDREMWEVYLGDDGKYKLATVHISGQPESGLPGLRTDVLWLPRNPDWRPKKNWLVNRGKSNE